MTWRFYFVHVALAVTLLLFFSDTPLVSGKNLCSRLVDGKTKIRLLGLINQGQTVMLITNDKVYEAPTMTVWNEEMTQLTVPTKSVLIKEKWPELEKDWGDAAIVNQNGEDFVVVSFAAQKGRSQWQSLKTAGKNFQKNYSNLKEDYLLVSSKFKSQALVKRGNDVCLHNLVFTTKKSFLTRQDTDSLTL